MAIAIQIDVSAAIGALPTASSDVGRVRQQCLPVALEHLRQQSRREGELVALIGNCERLELP